MKVGGIHVSMNPSPMLPGAPFLQVLKLHESEIDIKEGAAPERLICVCGSTRIIGHSH